MIQTFPHSLGRKRRFNTPKLGPLIHKDLTYFLRPEFIAEMKAPGATNQKRGCFNDSIKFEVYLLDLVVPASLGNKESSK
jgi:hypothetical protein